MDVYGDDKGIIEDCIPEIIDFIDEVMFVQTTQNIFKLHSEYKPIGNQPRAIEALVKGFQKAINARHNTRTSLRK